jgi:MFS family permease
VNVLAGIFRSRILPAFRPPPLPPISRRAFRLHFAYTMLIAIADGILANAPLMAVKALSATDAQLQMPLSMASVGLFISAFLGMLMAGHRKKPFVLIPCAIGALGMIAMGWTASAFWFLLILGIISICDFAARPPMPSIVGNIYPLSCRSHIMGTLRQHSSLAFLVSTLCFSALLSVSGDAFVQTTIRAELTLAGILALMACACFRMMPDFGDEQISLAADTDSRTLNKPAWRGFIRDLTVPLEDRHFRYYLVAFFIFCCGTLSYAGIVPAYFARDLDFGYVQATLFLHVIPAIMAFLLGGRFAAFFDRTSVWRSFSIVTLLWGLDPLLIALLPTLPILLIARTLRGPATVGGMVLSAFTGVLAFSNSDANTARYASFQFLVNGVARLFAPLVAAMLSTQVARSTILIYGGALVLLASAAFWSFERLTAKTTAITSVADAPELGS